MALLEILIRNMQEQPIAGENCSPTKETLSYERSVFELSKNLLIYKRLRNNAIERRNKEFAMEFIDDILYGDDKFEGKLTAWDLKRISDYNEEYWDIKKQMVEAAKKKEGKIDIPRVISKNIQEVLTREGFRVIIDINVPQTRIKWIL